MKNKKFLAGATLAAFATTLAPVAAFAAGHASPNASVFHMTEEKGEAEAGGDKVEVILDLNDSSRELTTSLNGKSLYIWAERNDDIVSDVDDLEVAYGTNAAKTGTGIIEITQALLNGEDGTVKVDIASEVSGEVTVRAALWAPGQTSPKVIEAGLIDNLVGEFEKSTSNDWKVMGKVNGQTVDLADGGEKAVGNLGAANGLDTTKIELVLKDENGKDYITDETVKISANKNGLNINKEEDTTDARGGFDFKVSADKPGTYEIDIEAGSNDYTLEVVFGSAGEYDLEVADEVEGAIALDEESDLAVVKFFDANGNEIDKVEELGLADDTTLNLGSASGDHVDVVFDVLAEPEDSDIDEDGDITLVTDGDDIVMQFTPEEEGNYEIKVALANGKNAVVEFEVVEQGDIVKMDLEYGAESLMLGGTSEAPSVYYVDADGVRAKATGVDFAATGKAVDNIDGSTGVLELDDDHDFAGSTVKVTAVSERHDVVATHTFTVVEEAEGVEFLTTDIAVNTDNKVQFAVVDSEGNKVALGEGVSVEDVTAVVLDKPEDARVSVDFTNEADLLDKGLATMEIYSTEKGEVEVQVVVKVDTTPTNSSDDKFAYYTGTAVFNVGDEAATGNAGVVTMFIGSTNFMVDGASTTMDVAPFIQDNRTFVPVRAFGEAVGAEVEYDEATQVITAVKGDVTVTMTVGKNIITTSEGETITADVAPFVKDGRTVLPLRAAAEAFGCDVEAISAVDGSTTGVIFTVK